MKSYILAETKRTHNEKVYNSFKNESPDKFINDYLKDPDNHYKKECNRMIMISEEKNKKDVIDLIYNLSKPSFYKDDALFYKLYEKNETTNGTEKNIKIKFLEEKEIVLEYKEDDTDYDNFDFIDDEMEKKETYKFSIKKEYLLIYINYLSNKKEYIDFLKEENDISLHEYFSATYLESLSSKNYSVFEEIEGAKLFIKDITNEKSSLKNNKILYKLFEIKKSIFKNKKIEIGNLIEQEEIKLK